MVDEKKIAFDPLPTEKALQKMRPVRGKWVHIPVNEWERQATKYRGICHIEGLHFSRKLALTFDDGPSNLTEPLLDLLEDRGVKATFFWLGRNLHEFLSLAKRAREQGHTFGNHSFDHTNFTNTSTKEVLQDQIEKTQQIFRDTIGIKPVLIRPPFGEITDEQIEALRGMGMKVVFWSVNGEDWQEGGNNAGKISHRVVNNIHEEAIVLMHDGGSARSHTVKAVRSIVDICRARGYEFVTLHDLIGVEESL